MQTTNDPHQQFAEFFKVDALKPYAYLLSKVMSEGSLCLHLDNLESQALTASEWCQQRLHTPPSFSDMPLVATDGTDRQPFVLANNCLYLQRYYRYETQCLERIQNFLAAEQNHVSARTEALLAHKDFIEQLFEKNRNTPGPDWQLAAVLTGLLYDFCIITGGPGTGKTTTVAKLLTILHRLQPDLKIALAAPTGKAAARMGESLRAAGTDATEDLKKVLSGLEPATLHRLLKSIRNTPYFTHNADNPLPYDVVVVDECSMIDAALFAKLLMAIGPKTRLILLGDKSQLAAVEAGSFFGDLCASLPALNQFSAAQAELINTFLPKGNQLPETSGKADNLPLSGHIVELRHSHRFDTNKGIGQLSRAVLENNAELLAAFAQGVKTDPEVTFDVTYDEQLFEQFISGYSSFIKEADVQTALKKLSELRVLCATHEGPQGVQVTNQRIERFLQKRHLIFTKDIFYENRPIILTRNYYEHGLFNGDTGIIRKNSEGTLTAFFENAEGTLKTVLPGYLSDAETAFAMTVHRSQGSEFSKVMILLPQQSQSPLLTRELLYTAITRAKKHVTVQADEATLLFTAQGFVTRASGIVRRLTGVKVQKSPSAKEA